MDYSSFVINYERVLHHQASKGEINSLKEFLSGLTEKEEKAVTEYVGQDPERIVLIEDLELFTSLLERFVQWGHEFENVLKALMYTPNREEHYLVTREKIEDYLVDVKYYADLVGTDLHELTTRALALLTDGEDSVRAYIPDYANLEGVLRHGFIPSYEVYDEEDITIALEHLHTTKRTLEHFYDKQPVRREFRMFVMLTEHSAKELYETYSESTAMLRWTYPHLLYSSQRIRTDMAMFRTPFSHFGTLRDGKLQTKFGESTLLVPEQGSPREIEGNYCLPVIRYANSLTSGKYHDEPEKEYCGTFYYHEPEAATFLVGQRILVVETKYSATKYLLEKSTVPDPVSNDVREALIHHFEGDIGALFRDWEEKKLKPDLLYTLQELYAENLAWNLADGYRPVGVDDTRFYCGKVLDLYAAEDPFDQILCLLAKAAEIDLVVLTRMVGSKQIVIEVLDARDREDSFKSLVYT